MLSQPVRASRPVGTGLRAVLRSRSGVARGARGIARWSAITAGVAIGVFHLYLFWDRLAAGDLLDPSIALRWLSAAGLVLALVLLRRMRIPLTTGRKACVVWLLVVLLHAYGRAPVVQQAPGDGFDASIDHYRSSERNRTFVLFDGEELAGMSSYLGIDASRQVLEIGGTYYRPHLRGTGFNRRIKDMMLSRAFDCGFRRVEFRVDRRNARSQAAMTKLGAVREGVLRADRITWNGHVRDTVLFAILKDEWPV